MHEHLETAPVWEAVRQKDACPLCVLRNMIEKQNVERFLGGAVMEPDIRLRTNAAGFCSRHHLMLMAQKDYHGYALMMQTRVKQVLGDIAPALKSPDRGSLFPSRCLQAARQKIASVTARCLVCESMAGAEERYMDVLIRLFRTDGDFKAEFRNGTAVCLDHLPGLMARAAGLGPGDRRELLEAAAGNTLAALEQASKDLDALCSSFHVGSEEKNNPRIHGALERSVNLLRGLTFDTDDKG